MFIFFCNIDCKVKMGSVYNPAAVSFNGICIAMIVNKTGFANVKFLFLKNKLNWRSEITNLKAFKPNSHC